MSPLINGKPRGNEIDTDGWPPNETVMEADTRFTINSVTGTFMATAQAGSNNIGQATISITPSLIHAPDNAALTIL